MSKNALKTGRGRVYTLPVVNTLNELKTNGELLESDFNGLHIVSIKDIPPIKFKVSHWFEYGVDRINNYSNVTRHDFKASDSIESIKVPVIKGKVALDLAIKYQQQYVFLGDENSPQKECINGEWIIPELPDTTYGSIVTSALLSADGFEDVAMDIAANFELRARNNIIIRLMYASFASRIFIAAEYMSIWIDVAGRSNKYGYTPEKWSLWYKSWSKETLTELKQKRPHRNIIGEDLKNYLLRVELEASKAISYIIAYNNIPDETLEKDNSWYDEGLRFYGVFSDLKKHNLAQIEKMKANLQRARALLNKHFEILMPPALAYPEEIYTSSIIEKVLPRSAYVFFSNSLATLTPSFSIGGFFDTTFDEYIYKPPYTAPKSSIDLDIANMEAKVIENNETFSANIRELNTYTNLSELLNLYNSCNDGSTSAINCLGFAHMRYRAYMENNYNEYVRIFNAYMTQLIIPAIHSLLAVIKIISDANSFDARLPAKESFISEMDIKLSKIESMLPLDEVNGQKQDGVFRQVEIKDFLEGVRNEMQIALCPSKSNVQTTKKQGLCANVPS